MEVLRLPPYPIETKWDVPLPNTAYTLYIEDLVDHSIETQDVTSDSYSQVTYLVTQDKAQFDRIFLFRVLDLNGSIVMDSNLDVIRPYVDYRKLGTTASEIEEYKMLELISRRIIDSIVIDGFYNSKHIVEINGSGSDYLPIWEDLNKILKVYQNNQLVYDYEAEDPTTNSAIYRVTLDNSSIIRDENAEYNRTQGAPLRLPAASGDLGYIGSGGVAFPTTDDFLFILDIGYRAVPPDIEYATKLLIDDLKCGKLDYFKRYITSYNTDQFRIQFDKSLFNGTGNMLVDKILENYIKRITKIGIL
jgi:hypothetical protein